MSVISSIFIFLLCLSMHACSARHFGVVRSTRPFHFSTKGLEKVELNFDSIQEPNEDGIVDKSPGGAITQELKDSKALLKELKHTRREISEMEHAGSETFKSSSHVGLLEATSIEGSRRRALSVVGSGFHDIKVQENVAVTDYEPPHRTPPIHN